MEPRKEPDNLYREMTEAATALMDAKPDTPVAEAEKK